MQLRGPRFAILSVALTLILFEQIQVTDEGYSLSGTQHTHTLRDRLIGSADIGLFTLMLSSCPSAYPECSLILS